VLVCAIATILFVRTELWLTNYPQLGGHGLHIAHLLWGALLMLIALVVLLALVSPAARQLAAVVGGVGLGLSIDELGKFLTADNNYFFKPTAAIIYCFFILFFLMIRQLDRRRTFTQREYLVNVIEMVKEAALRDMDETEQHRALALLEHADQSDPLVPDLRRMLEHVRSRPSTPPFMVTRVGRRARTAFFDLVHRPWAPTALIVLFSLWALGSLLEIAELIEDPAGEGHLDFFYWAELGASLLATMFVLAGLYLIRAGRRAGAFGMFERALLVALLFTQVFTFVNSQFIAVLGFSVNLLLFIAVRATLSRELDQEALQERDGERLAAAQAGS
jgi:hypothetical protein